MMKRKRWMVMLVVGTLLSLLAGAMGVAAQDALPNPAGAWGERQPDAESLAGNPFQAVRDEQGYWVVPAAAAKQALTGVQVVAATGGPDVYGYTWDDGVGVNWISAASGTDLPLTWQDPGSAPIDLGFEFKYYENTYNQFYISFYGFLSFAAENLDNGQSQIPRTEVPNNVVASQWAPYDELAAGGYIRYLKGGTAPNRWVVVEWNRIQMDTWDAAELDEYTFEAILHENGDIVFQYGTMQIQGGHGCQASGIEDARGLDGLAVTNFCQIIAGNHAVRITRPAPAARVQLTPTDQGAFSRSGGLRVFELGLRNTGELGEDTYDLSLASSSPNWTAAAYAADGVTPLVDTDGDGSVDTGSVAQGAVVAVKVAVRSPSMGNAGDYSQITLSAASSLDPTRSRTANLSVSIPAPFAQTYRDDADGAQQVYLVQPDRQTLKKPAAVDTYGSNSALSEAPNGNLVTAWEIGRCLDANCTVYISELEYAILNHAGNVIRPVARLTDFSAATTRSLDSSPVIAIAPNGQIGIVWQRVLFNQSGPNYNLFFASLDSAGNLSAPPFNLTNNNEWGHSAPYYFDGRIAATGDNRFEMTWSSLIDNNGSIRDIYYAIRDTQGTPIAAGKLTDDTPGWEHSYRSPAVTALANNRVLIAYAEDMVSTFATNYVILDSSGNPVKPETTLTGYSIGLDATQLSDGRIILAWTTRHDLTTDITYLLLDGTNYDPVFGPTILANPAAPAGGAYVSVTSDRAGRAILTWTDYDFGYRHSLYYTLIGSNGTVITPPMIFRSGAPDEMGRQQIESSLEGAGNTTYTMAPSSAQVDLYVSAPALVGAAPSSFERILVKFGNSGAVTASGITITATLDSHLGYFSDSLGVVPVLGENNTVTWTLPGELAYLGYGEFSLVVSVPDAAYGTRYPLTIAIRSAGIDGIPANNTARLEVMVARRLTLPVILKAP